MYMRIIIIVQSIIILLGGYYLYTQSQLKTVEPVTVPTLVPAAPADEHPGYEPPTENPPGYEAEVSATTTSPVTGPSDAGMEYPTMDTVPPEVR